ncbi:hypothetical protein K438DRAFT_1976376 [Mycena galopus ATCC 62051]|nr:hypothetical protein K438DRAFT_1983280 [Mycena galopus ATCC 62051]KAF8180921.1 hypothetical protein K438DRAFT_1976376 [Mycena galopus ATCC 62051]
MTSSITKPDYILPVNATEWDRLDAQSNAMDKLLGNKLCPEDIGQPRKILEIGAGSGAWAIHAAKLYPEADVLAVDMNPLPLPNAFSVLSRIIELVAPGGWLLADDINWSENFEGLDTAPSIKSALSHVIRSTEAVKGDPHFGPSLKPYLDSSSQLSEVHVREVDVSLNVIPEGMFLSGRCFGICLSDPGIEPLLAEFSRTFKETFTRAVAGAPTQTPTQKEIQQGFLDDMARDGADWQYSLQFYFTWSKKRA